MTTIEEGAGLKDAAGVDVREGAVEVIVHYLPATAPFRHEYPRSTVVETVRAAAMNFFGVKDRQERDTYRYFLEFEGRRLTNTSQTLEQLLGPHRHEATFHLIEQITPGADAK
jgi:hypothetical protein